MVSDFMAACRELHKNERLNPCLSGTWSLTTPLYCLVLLRKRSLNPCLSGTWSLTVDAGLNALGAKS